MQKKWQQRRATDSQSSSKILVTAKMFLGKEGNFQFITPEELFEFNDNGREQDIEEMAAFFDLVKQAYRILPNRKHRKDRGGNQYKYQDFNRSGNTEGVKVVSVGKIFDFIDGLYDNKFAINFTYDDLIEEAEQV